MKIILKIFSRNFLIRISYYILPILKILYSGNKFIDPIDGKGYSKFLSYGYGKLRKNAPTDLNPSFVTNSVKFSSNNISYS